MACEGRSELETSAGGISLRAELSLRGLQYAAARKLCNERTNGSTPGIIFRPDEHGCHGNFHPQSYAAICANANWKRRLEKAHTASKRMRLRSDWHWKELDCANSSDALLMNVFCHPGVTRGAKVRGLLGIEGEATPDFGFKPRTPLLRNKRDNTEVDMRINDLLVEAKLTESDFQTAKVALVERYRDLEEVFDVDELPVRGERVIGYQLIRGALAAHAMATAFCVICDARRPVLIEIWYRVIRAVRPPDLRCRLKLLTWQELASAAPRDLQDFLTEKYGIWPVGGL